VDNLDLSQTFYLIYRKPVLFFEKAA